MTNDIAKVEEVPVVALPVEYKPGEILNDAKGKAQALQMVIAGKRKPVIFNGEQYLEFEDWQTVARFYGLTAKVISTNFVEYGEVQGFEAKSVVLNTQNGMEISSADSMCLNDEKNWSNKPLFQLRSMAQTRACSKALRNVLAWVVVLAGFKPTPAEEIQDVFNGEKPINAAPPKPSVKASDVPDDQLGNWVMPKGKYQGRRLIEILSEVTSSGKAKGREYLDWFAENWQEPDQKAIVERFVKMINDSQ